MILEYIVKDNKYANIKQIAKEYFSMSERLIIKLKNKKLIFKNNETAFINESVKINDKISFNLDYKEDNDNIVPTRMDLEILFEDEALLIINKPPFTPIHPSSSHFSDSLSNAVKYFDKIGLNKKIRPVNRLDKDTSGIVIFAKNEYIQECLIKQMKQNTFEKFYLAITEGNFLNKEGIINAPISRKVNSIIEREINENGQNAITHFKVIKEFSNSLNPTKEVYSLVEFKLETGRTHQIRVHSAYIKHPLLGDTLYNRPSPLIKRQALHCYKLNFIHPITKENIEIISNLPNDIKNIINT